MISIFPPRLLHYKKAFGLLLFFGIVLVSAMPSYASHFRYGHLTWEPRASTTATFTLINAFTRSRYDGTAKDGFPAVGNIISEDIGATALEFGDGQDTGQLNYVVIAIDPSNDTMVCRALSPGSNTNTLISHTYPTPNNNGKPWMASINSCCRSDAEVNNPEGSYAVSTLVDLASRNRSPVSSLPTVVNVLKDSVAMFKVTAADADPNTLLTYRLATDEEGGGDFAQPGGKNAPKDLTIDPQTGIITWDVTGIAEGMRYSCQVIVEDRNATTKALRTEVAVDFIIQIVNCATANLAVPIFDAPSPDPAKVILAAVGEPVTFVINAADPNASKTAMITLNTGGLPPGATMTPELPVTGTTNIMSTFNWIPTINDVGSQVVTFTATNECGAQVITSYIIRVRSDIIPPTAQLVSPTNGQFTAGTPVMIRFSGQDNIGLNDFLISYSIDGGKTFVNDIARILSTENTVIWNIPDSLQGNVALRVTARDRDGNTGDSQLANLTINKSASTAPILRVTLGFDPPAFGLFTPPFSPRVVSVSEVRSQAPATDSMVEPNPQLITPFPDLLGYNVYRVPQPAEGQFPPTPDLIVRPENLVGSLNFNQNTFVDMVSTSKGDNFVYTITAFYSFGEVIGGFDPAATSLPIIKNPSFKKGRLSFDASGTFIRGGATLIVNDKESYRIEADKNSFFVRATSLSTNGVALSSLIKKGKTVRLVIMNPDGKTSVGNNFTK